jgi:hypothetical protein
VKARKGVIVPFAMLPRIDHDPLDVPSPPRTGGPQSLPVDAILFRFSTDPKQCRSAIEPNYSFFLTAVFRRHVQKELILTDLQECVARLSFYKRLGIKKRIGPRTNKLHYESMRQ